MLTIAYFQNSDRQIIEDILNRDVPVDVLNNEGTWQMLCSFVARHTSSIKQTDWLALCRKRCSLKSGSNL
jgi:hypothetical protein